MSEPYQIFILIPEGLSAKDTVYDVNDAVIAMGGRLEDDSLLILNETMFSEPEPEFIANPTVALETLANWLSYGSIDYAFPEGMITISYKGDPHTSIIEAIKISILERAFERGGQESKSRYMTLAQQLHNKFHAQRTIMDWGLEYKGFSWTEEISRLKAGEFVGEYPLVDLRMSREDRTV